MSAQDRLILSPASEVDRPALLLISVLHVFDDLCQGVVPAMLPFLVVERHYSYAAISGLTLAATLLSSVAQPAVGWWSDRRSRRWLIPLGMLTAALGLAVAGVVGSYPLTWLALALSGLGIAAFHPEAARAARQAAGNSTRAMSLFALGGNVGFALGSLVAAPVLVLTGLRGTPLLALPVAAVAVLGWLRLTRPFAESAGSSRASVLSIKPNRWPAFGWLTGVVLSVPRKASGWVLDQGLRNLRLADRTYQCSKGRASLRLSNNGQCRPFRESSEPYKHYELGRVS